MTTLTQWRPGPTPKPLRGKKIPMPRVASPVEFHLNLALIKHRRQEGVLREHRPGRRRIRIVRFAGFPIPALISRCRCCNAIWPCRELIEVLRARFGWTRKLNPVLTRLRRNLALGYPDRRQESSSPTSATQGS